MPRTKRSFAVGELVHVICRFAGGEFRIRTDVDRQTLLGMAAEVLPRTDWRAVGYTLMSSHIHWAMLAGENELEDVFQPLDTRYAMYLNRVQGRFGHVFAHRPKALVVEPAAGRTLLAYLHDNETRAGLVTSPRESRWSSHRAIVGLDPAPDILDPGLALECAGFDPTEEGARAFGAFCAERSGGPRDLSWSAESAVATRRSARERLGRAVEIATPRITTSGVVVPLIVRADSVVQVGGRIAPKALNAAVARMTLLDEEDLLSRRRTDRHSAARRVILVAWSHLLGAPSAQIASALGISAGAASQLLRPGDRYDSARRLAEELLTRLEGIVLDATG